MLQAVGRADLPVKIMIGCASFKLAFNYITVAIPQINIRGAAVGTLICYVAIMTISLFFLLRITNLKLNYMTVFVKPLISALLCGGGALITSLILEKYVSIKLATIFGIAVGGVIYIASLVLLRAITEEDLKMLPKGDKLAAFYRKLPGIKK